MTKRLVSPLKKYPRIYDFLGRIYYGAKVDFRHSTELLFGTKVREREWATRHLRKGNDWGNTQHVGEDDEWVMSYWDSWDHPHRPFLIERISKFSPSSILEIGCNCGPNLYLIAKKFPCADIRGVDINPVAVQKGNEWLAQEGISNVKLSVSKADELGQFQDKSFDVVFTDAILIYIGPDKIKKVMKDMIRITRRALILLEWNCFELQGKDPNGLGVHQYGAWKRDYVTLLKQFVPEEQFHVSRIPKGIWPSEEWQELGALIEVVL